ncbi:pyocin activator PrtN family protein [Paracoccus niistensis]|uniref:Pyocin activator PrtN family protein n=1 Tax=Paracoccus niistensis TaxID=632935 RepID=A0ABV6I527_9RHOB
MKPTTFDCLLAHFAGNPMLSIETVASYLAVDTETLVNKMNQRKIGLTYFRATDGQKGKKFVMVADLAAHIDACHQKAVEEMAKFA